MSRLIALGVLTISITLIPNILSANGSVYGKFPVTLKDYKGGKTNSVSYGGQIARHVLHDSLKKLAGEGNGASNPELKARFQSILGVLQFTQRSVRPDVAYATNMLCRVMAKPNEQL